MNVNRPPINAARKTIALTVITEGEHFLVQAHVNEYRNLMQLLNNSIYLRNFGECGGMGRCATCMIKITVAGTMPDSMDRNEKSTLGKIGRGAGEMRLACQILVTESLDGAVIEVVEEGY
jgi:2Fe-2S ferredoxin